jgi:hypothetical protein
MLLGVTLLKKKYPLAKYLCVLLIVAGVALFMYKPKKVVGMEEHTIGYGELLLVCGLRKVAFSSKYNQRIAPCSQKISYVLREVVVPITSHFWSLLKAMAGSLKYLTMAKFSFWGRKL